MSDFCKCTHPKSQHIVGKYPYIENSPVFRHCRANDERILVTLDYSRNGVGHEPDRIFHLKCTCPGFEPYRKMEEEENILF